MRQVPSRSNMTRRLHVDSFEVTSRKRRKWYLISALCLFFAASASGQTSPPVSFRAAGIHDAGLHGSELLCRFGS